MIPLKEYREQFETPLSKLIQEIDNTPLNEKKATEIQKFIKLERDKNISTIALDDVSSLMYTLHGYTKKLIRGLYDDRNLYQNWVNGLIKSQTNTEYKKLVADLKVIIDKVYDWVWKSIKTDVEHFGFIKKKVSKKQYQQESNKDSFSQIRLLENLTNGNKTQLTLLKREFSKQKSPTRIAKMIFALFYLDVCPREVIDAIYASRSKAYKIISEAFNQNIKSHRSFNDQIRILYQDIQKEKKIGTHIREVQEEIKILLGI